MIATEFGLLAGRERYRRDGRNGGCGHHRYAGSWRRLCLIHSACVGVAVLASPWFRSPDECLTLASRFLLQEE